MSRAEQKAFIQWAWEARQRTTFDSNVMSYPVSYMFIAEDGPLPCAFLPTQSVLMAEAFIPRPGISNFRKALSLGRFDEALMSAAKKTGIGDVYCYVPIGEIDYANKIERHGWKEVEGVRLFRKSVS